MSALGSSSTLAAAAHGGQISTDADRSAQGSGTPSLADPSAPCTTPPSARSRRRHAAASSSRLRLAPARFEARSLSAASPCMHVPTRLMLRVCLLHVIRLFTYSRARNAADKWALSRPILSGRACSVAVDSCYAPLLSLPLGAVAHAPPLPITATRNAHVPSSLP